MAQVNLVVLGGSRAFGTAFEDCDYDYYGLFTFSAREFTSLYPSRESYQFFPSENVDCSFHELGKFCRLALNGNPTIIDTLFAPLVIYQDAVGKRLREIRDAFLSTRVLSAYVGYATNQLERYRRGSRLHSKGGSLNPKFMSHAVRLLYGGLHLARTGEFLVQLPDEGRELVLSTRDMPPEEAISQVEVMLNCLLWAKDHSDLPKSPTTEAVQQMVFQARLGAMVDTNSSGVLH